MDKKLQNLAWSVLPKEFKEEVKENYRKLISAFGYFQSKTSLNNEECNRCDLIREKIAIYNELFGTHYLTSDAEEEEMLCCEKSKVIKLYKKFQKDGTFTCLYAAGVLDTLFGSKCLPDQKEFAENANCKEPKSAEPKFEMGDLVTIDDSPRGYVINGISYDDCYGEYLYGLTVYDAFKESELKLVPHSKLNMGDKVRVKENNRIGTIIEPYSDDVGYRVFFDDGDGGEDAEFSEDELELYKEPVKPKFKGGDLALVRGFKHPLLEQDGAIVTILSYHEKGDFYSCAIAPNVGIDVDAKYLEPYTEPREDHIGENHEMVKDFDTILKDGFSKERRLTIAAMAMQGMLSNTTRFSSYEISDLVRISLNCADALITESKGGGTK